MIAAVAAAATAIPVGSAQAASPSACSSGHLPPAPAALERMRHATLCLINRERQRHGLAPLRANDRLRAAATGHSRNMVRANFFAHGNFVARILNSRYVRRGQVWSLGENIAWGSGGHATPAYTVGAWMRSPGHRANILNPRFRDIGVGIWLGSPLGGREKGAVYTTDFGARR